MFLASLAQLLVTALSPGPRTVGKPIIGLIHVCGIDEYTNEFVFLFQVLSLPPQALHRTRGAVAKSEEGVLRAGTTLPELFWSWGHWLHTRIQDFSQTGRKISMIYCCKVSFLFPPRHFRKSKLPFYSLWVMFRYLLEVGCSPSEWTFIQMSLESERCGAPGLGARTLEARELKQISLKYKMFTSFKKIQAHSREKGSFPGKMTEENESSHRKSPFSQLRSLWDSLGL